MTAPASRPRARFSRWFGKSVKPARPGVYETKLRNQIGVFYSKWDGSTWYFSHSTVQSAADDWLPVCSKKRWRGLAEKP